MLAESWSLKGVTTRVTSPAAIAGFSFSGILAGIDVARVVIPFKDQDSANIVKAQLKDLSIKLQTTIQPVFGSQKIGQDLKECETKPQLVNQQCAVYQFKCNLCDTGSYVGYTRRHLYARVDGHRSTSSSVRKHYDSDHAGAVPEDLLSCFKVLKKQVVTLELAFVNFYSYLYP